MPESSTKYHPASRAIITGTSLVLGAGSLALIFAPAEVASAMRVMDAAAVTLILQVYGAALFGLAMTGWMVRHSIVGGIFGRSYVVGNAAHAFVGAFALIRPATDVSAPWGLRIVTIAYCALALVFGYLMFAASPQSGLVTGQ